VRSESTELDRDWWKIREVVVQQVGHGAAYRLLEPPFRLDWLFDDSSTLLKYRWQRSSNNYGTQVCIL
jgi:hypothetical protein